MLGPEPFVVELAGVAMPVGAPAAPLTKRPATTGRWVPLRAYQFLLSARVVPAEHNLVQ